MLYFSAIGSIMLEIGPLKISWYGFIIGSAIILSLLLALREARRIDMDEEYYVDVVLYGAPLAIIGARLYYVIFKWDYYGQNPAEIIAIWQGGLAIHGGIIVAFLVAYVYTRFKDISFWIVADVAAPSFMLGQAIGRWGNFINQEAHGGPITAQSQWLIDIMPLWMANQMWIAGAYRHPTFLYESLWSITGLIIVILWLRRQAWLRRGEVFLAYIIWYSIGRFFIEGMRTDSLMMLDTIRTAQAISVLLIVLALMTIWLRRKYGWSALAYGQHQGGK